MKTVEILALDGVLDTQLGMTLDLLLAANRVARSRGQPEPFGWRVVSIERKRIVSGAGLRIETDGLVPKRGRAPDFLVVLGVNTPNLEALAPLLARRDVARAQQHLRRRARQGTALLASCSATFLLAEAGLLDGRASATSWWLAPAFRARYPNVELDVTSALVPAGPIVTAGAAMAQVDLMLHLVRTVAGPEVAETCARYLLIDERESQARFMAMDHLAHRSEEVLRVERHVRSRLKQPLTLADLARAARTSPRTLARRFELALGLTPLKFVQRLRVERAAHLAATTSLSVEAIAEEVGYADAGALRRLMRRELGRSLRQLRPPLAG